MEKTERSKLETEDLANSQGIDFNSHVRSSAKNIWYMAFPLLTYFINRNFYVLNKGVNIKISDNDFNGFHCNPAENWKSDFWCQRYFCLSTNENGNFGSFRYEIVKQSQFEFETNISATFFVIAMVYMGISYNAAELPGNIWWNNAINGILDAAANGIGIVLLGRFSNWSALIGWKLWLRFDWSRALRTISLKTLEVKFGRKTLLFWSLALTGKNFTL